MASASQKGKEAFSDFFWGCGSIICFIIIVGWLFVVLFGNYFKEGPNELVAPSRTLLLQCLEEFKSHVRIEPRWGGNVRVYVRKDIFENLDFPDREDLLKKLGMTWFNTVNCSYLPVLSVHDIRTGKKLASTGWLHSTLTKIATGFFRK